jgi:hypothetical protein
MTSKARRTLAVAASAFMLAVPVAQAMPMDEQTGRPAHMDSAPSIGMEYGDLRRSAPAVEPAPVSGGFDWMAAAIGAAAATGLAVVSLTAFRVRRPVGRRVAA